MVSPDERVQSLIADFVWHGVRLADHPHLRTRFFTVVGDSFVARSVPPISELLVIPRNSETLVPTAFQSESYIVFQNCAGSSDPALEPTVGSVLAFRIGRAAAPFAVVCVYSQREGLFADEDLTHIQLLDALLEYFGSPFLIFHKAQERASAALGRYLGWLRKWLTRHNTVLANDAPAEWEMLRWEQGLETPTEERVLECCYALGALAHARIPIVTLVDIRPNLLAFLREDPSRLVQITPEQFEHFVAERLDRMGFAVTLTGATTRKDGGIDIIGAKRDPALGNFLIAAQVKHHRVDNKTGRAAVDRLVSLKGGMFSFGLLVTNTYFTQDAKWVAAQAHNRHFAKLRDFQDMKNWLLENFAGERDYTELPDEIEIAPGIRIRVPRPDFSKLEFD